MWNDKWWHTIFFPARLQYRIEWNASNFVCLFVCSLRGLWSLLFIIKFMFYVRMNYHSFVWYFVVVCLRFVWLLACDEFVSSVWYVLVNMMVARVIKWKPTNLCAVIQKTNKFIISSIYIQLTISYEQIASSRPTKI